MAAYEITLKLQKSDVFEIVHILHANASEREEAINNMSHNGDHDECDMERMTRLMMADRRIIKAIIAAHVEAGGSYVDFGL